MKHLKAFNEEIRGPFGYKKPYSAKDQSNDDDDYKKSDDYEMLDLFVKDLGLNVTEEQIIKFLKDLSN